MSENTAEDASTAWTTLITDWLDWKATAAELGVTVTKVRTLIREHQLAAAVPAPGAGQQVPAELVMDGEIVKGVPGLLTLFSDGGWDDREMLDLAVHPGRLPPGPPDRRPAREPRLRGQAAGAGAGAVATGRRFHGPVKPRAAQTARWVAWPASPASTPRARSVISAAARAASERSVSSLITASTCCAGAGGVDQAAQALRPGPASSGGAERGVEDLGVGDGQGVERERDQHGALALDQVVAGRLAGDGRVAEDAEQVVAQLEGLAQRQPEPAELGDHLGARPGEGGADVERPLDGVLRRLVAQHRHRRVHVGRPACLGGDVEELAGDDLAAGEVEVAERVEHPLGGQAAGAQQLVGPAEQQVAEQDRRGGAVLLRAGGPAALAVELLEGAVGGRPATSYVGGVHVVVVHQGAGVQQLEGGAGAQQRDRGRSARRRRGGPTSRTPPGSACRRRRWCGRARPGAARRDRAGRASSAWRATNSCSVDSMSSRKPGTRPILGAARSPGERRPVSSAPCLRDSARIGDLLRQGGRSFSFEFFPPKDEAGEEVLWRSISELEPLQPTFVSVTYGAGGTTRDRTIAITARIARETSMLPMAHLTCVGHTTDELTRILDVARPTSGVRNVLALRGDPPGRPRHRVGVDRGRDRLRLRAGRVHPRRSVTSRSGWRPSPRAIATPRRSTPTWPCSRPSTTPARSSR